MSRSLILVSCAAVAATVPFLTATPADAGHRMRYQACVVTEHSTRLRVHRCDYRCRRWVRRGRAFRVRGQYGEYLRVRNLSMHGWIDIYDLRLAPEAYCRAAGI